MAPGNRASKSSGGRARSLPPDKQVGGKGRPKPPQKQQVRKKGTNPRPRTPPRKGVRQALSSILGTGRVTKNLANTLRLADPRVIGRILRRFLALVANIMRGKFVGLGFMIALAIMIPTAFCEKNGPRVIKVEETTAPVPTIIPDYHGALYTAHNADDKYHLHFDSRGWGGVREPNRLFMKKDRCTIDQNVVDCKMAKFKCKFARGVKNGTNFQLLGVCPVLPELALDVDRHWCVCTDNNNDTASFRGVKFVLHLDTNLEQVPRDMPHRKHSPTPYSDTWRDWTIAHLDKIEETVMGQWHFYLVLFFVAYLITKNTFMTLILVLAVIMYGPVAGQSMQQSPELDPATRCTALNSREIIAAGGSTEVFMSLTHDHCVTVQTRDKRSFSVFLEGIRIKPSDMIKEKILALDCEVNKVGADFGCPQSGHWPHVPNESAPNTVCTTASVSMGWGDGCGLFGTGTVKTCAHLKCGKEVQTYSIRSQDIVYEIAVWPHIGTGKSTGESFEVSSSDMAGSYNVQGLGIIDYDCTGSHTGSTNDMRIVETPDSGFFYVHEGTIDAFDTAYKYPGGDWENLAPVITWRDPKPRGSAYSLLEDQTHTLMTALASGSRLGNNKSDLLLTRGSLACRMFLGKIKPIGVSAKKCKHVEKLSGPVKTDHGTHVIKIRVREKCEPQIKAYDVTATDKVNKAQMVTIGLVIESEETLEFTLSPGRYELHVGGYETEYLVEGSRVAYALNTRVFGPLSRVKQVFNVWNTRGNFATGLFKGAGTLVVGIVNALTGGMSWITLTILGFALIWLGLQSRNDKVLLMMVVLGGLIAATSMGTLGAEAYEWPKLEINKLSGTAEAGCSMDLKTSRVRCGKGLTIYSEVTRIMSTLSVYGDGETYETLMEDLQARRGACVVAVDYPTFRVFEKWGMDTNYYYLPTAMPYTPEREVIGYRNAFAPIFNGNQYNFPHDAAIQNLFNQLLNTTEPRQDCEDCTHRRGVIMMMSSPRLWKKECRELTLVQATFMDHHVSFYRVSVVAAINAGNKKYECSDIFLGAGVKDERAMHTSYNFELWSSINSNEEFSNITHLEMASYVECQYPKKRTIGVSKGLDKMFMPWQIGGPVSTHNAIAGYGPQNKMPWFDVPLELGFGPCAGHTIHRSSFDTGGDCSGDDYPRDTRKAGNVKAATEFCNTEPTKTVYHLKTKIFGCVYPPHIVPRNKLDYPKIEYDVGGTIDSKMEAFVKANRMGTTEYEKTPFAKSRPTHMPEPVEVKVDETKNQDEESSDCAGDPMNVNLETKRNGYPNVGGFATVVETYEIPRQKTNMTVDVTNWAWKAYKWAGLFEDEIYEKMKYEEAIKMHDTTSNVLIGMVALILCMKGRRPHTSMLWVFAVWFVIPMHLESYSMVAIGAVLHCFMELHPWEMMVALATTQGRGFVSCLGMYVFMVISPWICSGIGTLMALSAIVNVLPGLPLLQDFAILADGLAFWFVIFQLLHQEEKGRKFLRVTLTCLSLLMWQYPAYTGAVLVTGGTSMMAIVFIFMVIHGLPSSNHTSEGGIDLIGGLMCLILIAWGQFTQMHELDMWTHFNLIFGAALGICFICWEGMKGVGAMRIEEVGEYGYNPTAPTVAAGNLEGEMIGYNDNGNLVSRTTWWRTGWGTLFLVAGMVVVTGLVSQILPTLLMGAMMFADPSNHGLVFASGPEPVASDDTEFFTGTIPDRVFQMVGKNVFGLDRHVGYAVGVSGVLHAPYHCTSGIPLSYEGKQLTLSAIYPENDLVTYNGYTQLEEARLEDEVQVYVPRKPGQRFRQLPTTVQYYNREKRAYEVRYAVRTNYSVGDSGSPIMNADGKVVGLYGTGLRWNSDVFTTQYYSVYGEVEKAQSMSPEVEELMRKFGAGQAGVQWLKSHPGSGKTHNVLPALIQKIITSGHKGIIYVPNRVVAGELYKSLGKNVEVGFSVTGLPRNMNRRLLVICQATAVAKLISRVGHRLIEKAKFHIVDEAHSDSAEMKALRGYLHYQASTECKSVLLMTATPPGDTPPKQSRFDIAEHEMRITKESIKTEIETHNINASLIVVPTKKKVAEFARYFRGQMKDHQTTELHGDNFHDNYPLDETAEKRIIVATEIVEVGFNAKLDAVFDTGKVVRPILNDSKNIVTLEERMINYGAMIQRRGRVGRSQPGMYYCDSDWNAGVEERDDVSWTEARILMDLIHPGMPMEGYDGTNDSHLGSPLSSNAQRNAYIKLVGSDDRAGYAMTPWAAAMMVETDTFPYVNTLTGCHNEEIIRAIEDSARRGRPSTIVVNRKFPQISKSFKGREFAPQGFDVRCMEWQNDGPTGNFRKLTLHSGAYYSAFVDAILNSFNLLSRYYNTGSLLKSMEGDLYKGMAYLATSLLALMTTYYLGKWIVRLIFRFPSMIWGGTNVMYGTELRQSPEDKMINFITTTGLIVAIAAVYFEMIAFAPAAVGYFCCFMFVANYSKSNHSAVDDVTNLLHTIVMYVFVFLIALETRMFPTATQIIHTVMTEQPIVASGPYREPSRPFPFSIEVDLAFLVVTNVCLIDLVSSYIRKNAVIELKVANATAVMEKKSIGLLKVPIVFGEPVNIMVLFVLLAQFYTAGPSMTTMTCALILWGLSYWMIRAGAESAECGNSVTGIVTALVRNPGDEGERNFTLPQGADVPDDAVAVITTVLVCAFTLMTGMTPFRSIVPYIAPTLMYFKNNRMNSNVLNYVFTGNLYSLFQKRWIPFLLNAGFVILKKIVESNHGTVGARNMNLAEVWKMNVNALTKRNFDGFRMNGVWQYGIARNQDGTVDKGRAVSRGYWKFRELMERKCIAPRGNCVILGSGAGGWEQALAEVEAVTRVKGYTRADEGHTVPITFQTRGYNIVDIKPAWIQHVPTAPVNFVGCDIGEQNSNWRKEQNGSLLSLSLAEKWLEMNPGCDFAFKILTPSPQVMNKLRSLRHTYGGGCVRLKQSRNSNIEIYYTSGAKASGDIVAAQALTTNVARMKVKHGKSVFIQKKDLEMGMRRVASIAEDIPEKEYIGRLEYIKRRVTGWHVDKNHPYATWKYLGSYFTARRSAGGFAVNFIMRSLFWPWKMCAEAMSISMTDTSPSAISKLFREKVDTKVDDPPEAVKSVGRGAMKWLVETFRGKPHLTPRIGTLEEFKAKLRPDTALGWDPDNDWDNAKEAVEDPNWLHLVNMERQRHLEGRCEECIWSSMGKKEKKPQVFGKPKGSRLIWYLKLMCRFLEFEATGFVNEQHYFAKENCPAGVSGIPVHYLGYEVRKTHCNNGGISYSEDTAGWDTRFTVDDIRNEQRLGDLIVDPYHKKLHEAMYNLVYTCKVLTVTRESPNALSDCVVDVIVRRDHKASGERLTYNGNNAINITTELGRLSESDGVMTEEELHSDTNLETRIQEHLQVKGNKYLNQMNMSGDDKHVATPNPRYAVSLTFMNLSGKIRKDMDRDAPSRPIYNWEKIEFCSNHYHALTLSDRTGGEIVVPCRSQSELIGKSFNHLGRVETRIEDGAMNAKAYAGLFLILYFHRRDLRLGAMAAMASVPVNWLPKTRTTYSIHYTHEWLSNEDMLTIWNRVWITNNPHNPRVEPVETWQNVPSLTKSQDVECGSWIGTEARARWAREVPELVRKTRKIIDVSTGENNEYRDDYLSAMGRYRDDFVQRSRICGL